MIESHMGHKRMGGRDARRLDVVKAAYARIAGDFATRSASEGAGEKGVPDARVATGIRPLVSDRCTGAAPDS